jgi:hypothetical protein
MIRQPAFAKPKQRNRRKYSLRPPTIRGERDSYGE